MKKTHKLISLLLALMLIFGCTSALSVNAAETSSATGALPPTCPSMAFYNMLNWENVYIYCFSESGTIGAEWPGRQLTSDVKDDYGYDVYYLDFYEGTTGFVLTDNEGHQTDDITDFTMEGFYLDDNQTESYSHGYPVYLPVPIQDPVIIPDPPVTSRFVIGDADGNNVVNINDVTAIQKHLASAPVPESFNLDASDVDRNNKVLIGDATLIQYYVAHDYRKDNYCGKSVKNGKVLGNISYPLTDYSDMGKFTVIATDKAGNILPGVTLSGPNTYLDENAKYYYITIPEDAAALTAVSEDGQKTSSTLKKLVFDAELYIVNDTENTDPEYDYLFRIAEHHWAYEETTDFDFVNSLDWENVYVYEYDKDGIPVMEWPGEKLTKVSQRDGKDVYKVSVHSSTVGVVINDGKDHQTDDITDFYPWGDGYYLDASKTSEGIFGEPVYVPLALSGPDCFMFINSLGWENVYVYAYDEDGDVGKAYPGEKLTEMTENGFGEEVYLIEVPSKKTVGIVISDGNGNKTTEITDFNTETYFLNSNDISEKSDDGTTYNALTYANYVD